MSRKQKYTPEQKIQAVEDYLSGKKSATQIAHELNMGKRGNDLIRKWADKYRENGADVFLVKAHNNSYTGEFKKMVVESYLNGSGSLTDIANKYNIPSAETLRRWINRYTEGKDLKNYDPKPEVYMTKSRKTTKEERIEIVRYFIDHDKNYKRTAEKYECSYSQVHSWVKKYELEGEDGLADRRGRHKADSEVDEVEQLRRQVRRLEAQLKDKEIQNELLKKVQEIERRRYLPKDD